MVEADHIWKGTSGEHWADVKRFFFFFVLSFPKSLRHKAQRQKHDTEQSPNSNFNPNFNFWKTNFMLIDLLLDMQIVL